MCHGLGSLICRYVHDLSHAIPVTTQVTVMDETMLKLCPRSIHSIVHTISTLTEHCVVLFLTRLNMQKLQLQTQLQWRTWSQVQVHVLPPPPMSYPNMLPTVQSASPLPIQSSSPLPVQSASPLPVKSTSPQPVQSASPPPV